MDGDRRLDQRHAAGGARRRRGAEALTELGRGPAAAPAGTVDPATGAATARTGATARASSLRASTSVASTPIVDAGGGPATGQDVPVSAPVGPGTETP